MLKFNSCLKPSTSKYIGKTSFTTQYITSLVLSFSHLLLLWPYSILCFHFQTPFVCLNAMVHVQCTCRLWSECFKGAKGGWQYCHPWYPSYTVATIGRDSLHFGQLSSINMALLLASNLKCTHTGDFVTPDFATKSKVCTSAMWLHVLYMYTVVDMQYYRNYPKNLTNQEHWIFRSKFLRKTAMYPSKLFILDEFGGTWISMQLSAMQKTRTRCSDSVVCGYHVTWISEKQWLETNLTPRSKLATDTINTPLTGMIDMSLTIQGVEIRGIKWNYRTSWNICGAKFSRLNKTFVY